LFVGLYSAYAAPPAESIVGAYKFETEEPGNCFEVILECADETKCTFTTILKSGQNPSKYVLVLNSVRPVENLSYAANALKYAIDHQTQPSKISAEAMRQLEPALSTSPSISKCWDLNHPFPEFMLALHPFK